ncbi:MAG: arabinosyltransferase, partial [Rhodococcus sp.]|nr:arabinosyltransferase [Rhodococcus sp. (in: high G+C Gram-positive bacteria)]
MDAPASGRPGGQRSQQSSARLLAIVSSLVAILAALSIPFLPVQQEAATLSWPQNGTLTDVEAPLVSYAPLSLDADVPCQEIGALTDTGGVLLSTAPPASPDAGRYGLLARVTAGDNPHLQVTVRDRILLSEPVSALTNCTLEIRIDNTRASVGLSDRAPTIHDGDLRPQLVGIFTDLDGSAPSGLRVDVELDSRFSSSPTVIKLVAMAVAILATLLALISLHRLDATDGRSTRRFLPARWWTFSGLDALVIGTLLLWHFIGATTADDGYQFTMARASEHAGYMANYFRWFGVP